MASKTDANKQGPYFILTSEEADRLVSEALETEPDEPEGLVRLLLTLRDHIRDSLLEQAFHELIKAAYNRSVAHSVHLDEYLKAVRQGRRDSEEART